MMKIAAVTVLAAIQFVLTDGPLEPKRVAEAIAIGESNAKLAGRHIFWTKGGCIGCPVDTVQTRFSTPFLRVVEAARHARVNFRPFTAADVTPEMGAPEIHVYAYPLVAGPDVRDVTTVVITPARGSEDDKRSQAIMPIRTSPIPTEHKNLFGAAFKGDGMLAVFPLRSVSNDNELRVVYAGGITRRDRFSTDGLR